MKNSPIFLLVMLGALSGLTSLAVDMYLPSIPTIAQDLHVNVEAVQLTVSTFLAGYALGQLFYGPLADSFGRKPVILFGMALFVLASLGCVFSTTLPALLAFRLLQAIGGAAGAVVVNALMRDLFSTGEEIARAMTIVILTFTLAPLVAPLLGGAMLPLGWHSIFVFLTLVGTLLLFSVGMRIPETLKPEHKQPLHLGKILGNYYLVLRHRRAMGSLLASTFTSAGMFAFISYSPYVYIQYFGVAPQHYGFLFGIHILMLMLMTFINGRLVKRVGLLNMLMIGLVLAAVAGGLLLINSATGWGGLWGVALPVACYIGQLGLIGANANSHALGFFPANAGTASALGGTLRFGVGALAGVLVNCMEATSPVPMGLVMAGSSILGLVCYLCIGRGQECAKRAAQPD